MIKSESNFIVRTPLFPLDVINDCTYDGIRKILSQSLFNEAVFIASNSFYPQTIKYREGELTGKEFDRVNLTLIKYLLRTCSRATPFGFFASVSVGRWSSQTNAKINRDVIHNARLDSQLVRFIVNELLDNEEIVSRIKYFPNNTLYKIGDRVRYTECLNNLLNEFVLSDAEIDQYLNIVLEISKQGLTRGELVSSLIQAGISKVESLSYIESLIGSNILTSELEISLTGKDYFNHILRVLARFELVPSGVQEIDHELKSLNEVAAPSVDSYQKLIDLLKFWNKESEFDHFLQVDTYRQRVPELNQNVAKEIEKTVEILAALPSTEGKSLAEFKSKFFERYEYETVDLCAALDPEIGIGYASSVAAESGESGLLSFLPIRENESTLVNLTPFQQFLINKYIDALQTGSDIELDENQIKSFEVKDVNLPKSSYAFVSLYAKNQIDLDKGDFKIHLLGSYGPSAVTLMARFCHLHPSILAMCQECIAKEESDTDALFAEIVHVNQVRNANISTRPTLRKYEIPILSVPGVNHDCSIELSDLTLSIVGKKLMLRSKKLKKEVIPRLSSAHNFSHETIPIYRFLCDLQFQNYRSTINWDWGILRNVPFLPRVSFGKSILAARRWRVNAKQAEIIKKSITLGPDVESLRKTLKLPAMIVLGEGDHKLTLDLENENHLYVFQNLMRENMTIEECLSDNGLVFSDEVGKLYINELIIPMSTHEAQEAPTQNERIIISDRNFEAGSEWLYYKIYCSPITSDRLLVEKIRPLIEDLIRDQVIDQWFFVRYIDTEHHIRIRFHGKGEFYKVVIQRINVTLKDWMKQGFVTRLVIDNYKRELERYGDTITYTEEYFYIDSNLIVQVLDLFEGNEDLRWQVAIVFADQVFSAFGFSLESRRDLSSSVRNHFFKEMDVSGEYKRSLDALRRRKYDQIANRMTSGFDEERITSILEFRKEKIEWICKQILNATPFNNQKDRIDDLIKSYIHMSINRLFTDRQRQHEMVIYDFIHHHYNSTIARKKNV